MTAIRSATFPPSRAGRRSPKFSATKIKYVTHTPHCTARTQNFTRRSHQTPASSRASASMPRRASDPLSAQ